MALLMLGKSRCSICREVLFPGQVIVATSHFISDPIDHLWRFSDSGMHAECFSEWEHREEFSAHYYAELGRTLPGFVPAKSANPGGPGLPKFRLAVLGTSEERAEYLETLQTRIAQITPPVSIGGE